MARLAAGDIKAILRRFAIEGSDDTDRHIENIRASSPSPINELISFKFNKRRYLLLFDETADDDLDYLRDQVAKEEGGREGSFIPNPNESFLTYGLPFEGKTIYLFLAQADKKRLDLTLAEMHPDSSRSTWQKHIRAGHVKVNGETTTSPRFEVGANDSIEVDLPEETDYSQLSLPTLHQDDNVIVIDKPAGVLTHSKGALNDEFTVAEFFKRHTSVGLETNRPGIIHRLDRDTSGVMIGALSEAAAKLLARQFAERKVKKTYIAVVSGRLKQMAATIDLPIDRNPAAPSTFRVDAKGKEATTHYTVLAENDKESLVELRPVTGRTHQLRVHMAYLGAPIKGDRVYGKEADRLYLHAHKLEITIPTSDRRIFEAPIPAEFTNSFNEVSE